MAKSEIDCDYDDIGYEAGRIIDEKTGEVISYSRLDMEVLTKFDQIHRQKHLVEDQIDGTDKKMGYFANDKKVFDLSPQLVSCLSQIAFSMYLFYGREPHMREAFDQMLNNGRKEKQRQREFEIAELNNLWNTP